MAGNSKFDESEVQHPGCFGAKVYGAATALISGYVLSLSIRGS
jgi:hypothetical protein